jgi:hypothetical protein
MSSIVILVFTAVLGVAAAQARPFESADAAYALARALDQSGLTAIATAVPHEPGMFVAALYFPGSQLLVVSARHPSPERIASRIAMRRYREAYLSLLGTPMPQGKFYVRDANADGILSALPDSGDVDLVREGGVRQTSFDGQTESQGLTSTQYDIRLAAADARYADLLTVLASAVHAVRERR